MRPLLLAVVILHANGCAIADAIHAQQQATVACRDLGFFAATKDSGVWYCYRDKLLNGTMP